MYNFADDNLLNTYFMKILKSDSNSLRSLSRVVSAVIVMAITAGMLFTSCDDDEKIWDIGGVSIPIRIVDEQGTNLLDPDVEGNWMDEKFYVAYNYDVYYVDWDHYNITSGENILQDSRAYMPIFDGLIAVHDKNMGVKEWNTTPRSCMLIFGAFSGDQNQFIEVDFMIPSINTVFHIAMTHTIEWKHDEPVLKTSYTLNGQPVKSSAVTIVLPRKSN